jgi:hypothetical protein
MDFLKKHYEKIILIAVLLGVVGFLVFLPFVIAADQQELTDKRNEVVPTKVNALPELDMTRQQNILERLQTPPNVDFSTRHKLFNPIEWKRDANGVLFPIKNGNEIGAGAAVVTKITPLYLVVTLDQVDTNSPSPRYVIGLEHQAAATAAMRHKQTRYAAVGEKKDLFTMVSVKGDPLNPDQVVLKLTDTGETVVLTRDKSFQRVDAYTADLKYDPEKKTFAGRRVNSTISFNGEDYIIVAIGADQVILSGQSNQKKTILHYTP